MEINRYSNVSYIRYHMRIFEEQEELRSVKITKIARNVPHSILCSCKNSCFYIIYLISIRHFYTYFQIRKTELEVPLRFAIIFAWMLSIWNMSNTISYIAMFLSAIFNKKVNCSIKIYLNTLKYGSSAVVI